MKFKKALKLLKQGQLVKTPLNNIVKLDTERNYLTTFDGYYLSDSVSIDDILSDDWQIPSEYELQCLKDNYDMEHTEPEIYVPKKELTGIEIYVPKKELTGIEFIRDIRNKQYIVNFNAGKYPNAYALHTYNLLFSQLSKLKSADELAQLFAQVILDYDDCTICTTLLKLEAERFWRGGL